MNYCQCWILASSALLLSVVAFEFSMKCWEQGHQSFSQSFQHGAAGGSAQSSAFGRQPGMVTQSCSNSREQRTMAAPGAIGGCVQVESCPCHQRGTVYSFHSAGPFLSSLLHLPPALMLTSVFAIMITEQNRTPLACSKPPPRTCSWLTQQLDVCG